MAILLLYFLLIILFILYYIVLLEREREIFLMFPIPLMLVSYHTSVSEQIQTTSDLTHLYIIKLFL